MAVKIKSRFASALETAETLGVPRRRAAKLIELVVSSADSSTTNNGLRLRKIGGSPKRKLTKRQTRAKLSKAAH